MLTSGEGMNVMMAYVATGEKLPSDLALLLEGGITAKESMPPLTWEMLESMPLVQDVEHRIREVCSVSTLASNIEEVE